MVVSLAFVSAILTFLVLMGAFGVEPQGNVTLGLLGFNVLLILLLLFLVGRHMLALRRETLAGMTGARLQRRVVGCSRWSPPCRRHSWPARGSSRWIGD